MDRALPPWAIDLIRDGVAPADLKKRGYLAVCAALRSTAMSAQMRGWDRMEWEALIAEPRSRLGYQLKLRDRHRVQSRKAVADTFVREWERAWEWRSAQDAPMSKKALGERARELATATIALAADPESDLSERERAVLHYAASEAARRGFLRVALPWREVAVGTGLTEHSTKRVLSDLSERGLLHRVSRGRANPDPSKRRAALYGLPAEAALLPYTSRVNRPMGGPAHTYGRSGTTDHEQEEITMEQVTVTRTLTISATSQEALAHAMEELLRQDDVRIDEPGGPRPEGTVLPIRRGA